MPEESIGEIIPPNKVLRIGSWSIPMRGAFVWGGIIALLGGPGGWLLGQFLQVRGVQSLNASRLMLAGLWVVGVLVCRLFLS